MLYLEVYPDIVFLLNFLFDLILIIILKKAGKKNSSPLRMISAASLGGGFAVILSIFPWINYFFKFIVMYVAASLLMIVVAFGRLKAADLFKQWVVLNLITYFIGGFINAVYYHTNLRLHLINIGRGVAFSNIPILYVCAAAVIVAVTSLFLIWLLRLYQLHRPLIYDVELIFNDRKVKTKGLMDTGNCLYDPLRSKPVMVMENTVMEQLMTPEIKSYVEEAKSFLEGKAKDFYWEKQADKIKGFSFIPYRSVGKCGMLLGVCLDKVIIHTGKEVICNEQVTAAICDNPLTDGKDYHVILHKELL